mmetsp:Transcript_3484/g.8128  ORF Transcript_3484/g.8128 Transcript_3484/m.8128 type:complete len:83 (-) Transcript_3484:101-349(-)
MNARLLEGCGAAKEFWSWSSKLQTAREHATTKRQSSVCVEDCKGLQLEKQSASLRQGDSNFLSLMIVLAGGLLCQQRKHQGT